MNLNIKDGWLAGAEKTLDSPNADHRPKENDISLIVIHCISLPPGEFGGEWIDRLFTNTLPPEAHPYFAGIHHLRVSAHLLIRRDGSVTQYVPFHRRAWHAGVSNYQGRAVCNDFSIGIELEGTEAVPYTDAQYQRLAAAVAALLAHYPTLSREAIVGHSDIAPGRKTDPGPSFEWERFFRLLD
ncbi:MAG: 1,6-anhydro-N-acetylmuramyl-L-alanine amidase AmpD, partial [Candidatus Methylumidiphilus sp.]